MPRTFEMHVLVARRHDFTGQKTWKLRVVPKQRQRAPTASYPRQNPSAQPKRVKENRLSRAYKDSPVSLSPSHLLTKGLHCRPVVDDKSMLAAKTFFFGDRAVARWQAPFSKFAFSMISLISMQEPIYEICRIITKHIDVDTTANNIQIVLYI
jgi:hypothetical protein